MEKLFFVALLLLFGACGACHWMERCVEFKKVPSTCGGTNTCLYSGGGGRYCAEWKYVPEYPCVIEQCARRANE